MDTFSDPFCFNKQTSALLRGLGAAELIPEFKRRNISTNTLHELSVEELVMLGATHEQAEEIRNALNVKRRRTGVVVASTQERIQHYLEIIKTGEHQLSLIQAFTAYCRLRLMKERINMFVNPNKCLSASKILPISVNATLTEVEAAMKNLQQLEKYILRLKVKPKGNNTRQLYVLISGLGLVTIVLFKVLS